MNNPLKTTRQTLILLLASVASGAYAQSFEALTPGAIQPEQPTTVLPSPDEADIVSVPDPFRRSIEGEQGPAIAVADFELVLDKPGQIDSETLKKAKTNLDAFISDHQSELTLGLLEQAAGLTTDTLRSRGYLLARAIVPPQEVEKGVVRLDVYVGVLGQTDIEDNRIYSDKSLENAFSRQQGESVRREEIESSLLRVRDLPGLAAVAVFGPGQQVGETALGIRVTEERRFDYRLRLDNHGIDATGKYRLLGGVSINNITGHRDRLSLDAVRTFDSSNLYNARVNYEITGAELVHTFGLGYGETHYEVDRPSPLTIDGDVETGDIYLRSQWKRSRNANFSTRLGLATKRAESDSNFVFLDGIDRLTVASFSLVVDGVDSRFKGLHRATLTFDRGFDDFIGSMDSQGNGNSLGRVPVDQQALSGRFEKVSASYARLQSLSANHSLLLRFAGQYSNDYLSSLEKMSLGGPNTVRAYPVSEFVAERATFASLAWVVNGSIFSDATVYGDYTLGDVFTVSLFADYGWGKNRGSDGSVTRREIDGAGIQLEFRLPDKDAFLDLAVAQPLDGDEALNGDDFQFWFSTGIQF